MNGKDKKKTPEAVETSGAFFFLYGNYNLAGKTSTISTWNTKRLPAGIPLPP